MICDFELQEDRTLGEGALGTLYAGRQRSTQRNVTITVLRDEFAGDAEFERRFHREMALAVQVIHPSVVRTLGTGVWKRKLFYATERVEGKNLSEHLRREKRLGSEEIYRVAEAGGEALVAADQWAIAPVHLRTSGFFLLADGAVKAADLGLSRVLDREEDFRRFVQGALAYSSPERIHGQVPDVRSDIFALGVILYELATGQLPFDGHESPASFAYQLVHSSPRRPSEVASTVPREMERLILRCLAKQPGDRYQTAGDLLQEFRAAHRAVRRSSQVARSPDRRAEEFEIHENQVLGQGGMGTLYRGHQRSLNREVAIKVIQAGLIDDIDVCLRFHDEAELLAQVHDGNVVQIFGAGIWKGRPFYAMELVEGEDLSRRLATGPPLAIEEILDVAEGVGRALRAVWRYKIVHRDIKPANIFLEPDGTVKVADFGLATCVRLHPVESRYVMGTLGYISPEQGTGVDVDIRSDIYSLGIVLFELASGDLPFPSGGTPSSVIRRHRFATPPSLSAKGLLPEYMDAIVQRCIAKRPDQRFQTPDDLIEHVQNARRRFRAEAHPFPPSTK